jgi:hypothetical protein
LRYQQTIRERLGLEIGWKISQINYLGLVMQDEHLTADECAELAEGCVKMPLPCRTARRRKAG